MSSIHNENDILNNYIIASNDEVQREKYLDILIKSKIYSMEENNREQCIEIMALIDERTYITDSVEEFNERLRKHFNISHLHSNASRIEIFAAATDDELNDWGF
jgi:hypothetical protein